ncbi:cell division protein FtsK [Arcobacter sp. 31_11_sub10_T18]|nr:cell division protein FtsK [Arcobacter sp. 31_11_sub10_T18]
MFISDEKTVGKIGAIFASYSHNYFGYISYGYLLLFLYPIYKINTIYNYQEKLYSKLSTLLVLFVSLILAQSLIISGTMSGIFGNQIISYLIPYIGNAGLWVMVIIGLLISMIVLFENKKQSIILNFKDSISSIKFKSDTKKKKEKNKRIDNKNREKRKEEKFIVKEVGDTAEIIIEASEDKVLIEELVPVESTENLNSEEKEAGKQHPHALIVDELEENKKLLDQIEVGVTEQPKDFQLPRSDFFQKSPKEKKNKINESFIDKKIEDLLDKLAMFKIDGDVVRTYSGPVVTTFEFKPAPNVKVSKILNLQDDLAMALKAQTIRIQAPIPGKDVVGIEVPNEDVQTIYLRELLESELFQNSKSSLTMILGKDIVGKPFITDLKKLPHLLIAGTTGSGKSVGINSMILSLLYKNSPDNLKLVMIDPKMLEFSMYNDIPHLLTPVITKPAEAINALSNMVAEMERRYTLMSKTKTKNIENYNEKSKKEDYEPFPYIVIIIDELADLMMTSGKEVELSIARLAQMARASGIHLIVATQRPSVDVVTGLIKANLPSRISYKVGQKVDSKIILDSMGAESLLGRGDMLFTPPGMSGLVRVHAPWSAEDEIEKVVDFLKDQRDVDYDLNFLKQKIDSASSNKSSSAELGELDELFEEAKNIVLSDQKSSISYLQRKLRIGYNRSATIVEQLETSGILSAPNIKGNREILV